MEPPSLARRLEILRNQLFSTSKEGSLAAYFMKDKVKDFLFRDLKSFRDEIFSYANDSSLFKESSVLENQEVTAYRTFRQFVSLVKISGLSESMAVEHPEKLLLLIEVANTLNRSLGNIFLAHFSAYYRCISLLGTEKHMIYIAKAFSLQDIGCVALGEISGGLDLNKIETEAIYEPESAEFLLRTPSHLATKFWVGNGAKLANKCVVFANLIVEDQNQGPHAFLISLRQDHDHLPLPGIEIGEIGSIPGSLGGDIGFIKFSDVRVPRDSLLDKYSSVTESGGFITDLEDESERKATLEECFLEEKFQHINASLTLSITYLLITIKMFNKKTYASSPFSINKLVLQSVVPLIAYRFSGRALVDYWIDFIKSSKRAFTMENLKFLINIITDLSNQKCSEAIMNFKKLIGSIGSSQHSRLPSIFQDSVHKKLFEIDSEFDYKRMAKSIIDIILSSEERETALPFINLKNATINPLSTQFNELKLDETTELTVFKRLVELAFLVLINKGRKHYETLLQKSVSIESAFDLTYSLYYEKACTTFANLFSLNQMSKLCQEKQNSFKLMEALCKYWSLKVINDCLYELVEAEVVTTSQVNLLRHLELSFISRLNVEEIASLLDYIAPAEETLGSKKTPIRDLVFTNNLKGSTKILPIFKLLLKMMNSIKTARSCYELVPWWQKIKNPFFS